MPEITAVFELRAARAVDAAAFERLSTGPIAGKRAFISESLERRTVVGAYAESRAVGYVIWDRAFFARAFIWLLGVDPAFRRAGIGGRLLETVERACRGESLFTSTNESNTIMQRLLCGRGFVASGRVDNLDPGDPELFYVKAAKP